MESVWKTSTEPLEFDALCGDIKTDVLIIGGGICGLLCAHMLKEASVDYILVEADRICNGITKNTTAKLTFQHGLIYDNLIKSLGKEKAMMYLCANRNALYKYFELCEKTDCDFSKKDAYVYSLNNRQKIENEIKAYKALGVDAEFVSSTALPFDIAGAVKIRNQAQFHPLKFLYSLSRGLNIKENTKVLELRENVAVCNNGKISAKKIIVATHFPLINKHGSYFLKLYQHRSYVLALSGAQNVNGLYVDENEKGMSFRNYEDLLFVGGGDHRTGKKGGAWQELLDFADKYYPCSQKVSRFATQDCMSLDGIPYIGKYSACTHELYVATGFNKWGMTSSMAAAMMLCDMVRGKESPYAKVFSPSRSMLTPKLIINAAEAAIGLIRPTSPRCPHLGCALKYNSAEHSWDCSCHGSRFTKDGELIDNPATDGIKSLKRKV